MLKFKFLCHICEITSGEPFITNIDNNQQIVIFRTEDNYYAIENRCPHAGAYLHEGYIEEQILICHWHGWKFNLETGQCLDDPLAKLKTYPLKLEGGNIYIIL